VQIRIQKASNCSCPRNVSNHAMRLSIHILTLALLSISAMGQDTTFYWGNSLTSNKHFNRYTIQKSFGKRIIFQDYSNKGHSWLKSDFSDSIIIENDSLILKFRKYHGKEYDSSKLTINKKTDNYEINEYHDNNILRFKANSRIKYPFSYYGRATEYYRNGQIYANYYYSNNILDSMVIAKEDSTLTKFIIQNRDSSLFKIRDDLIHSIIKNFKYILPTESPIETVFIIGLCIDNKKNLRVEIIKKTSYNLDNELLKSIEKIDIGKLSDKDLKGCILMPIRIELQ
jgi:hypothetical protein